MLQNHPPIFLSSFCKVPKLAHVFLGDPPKKLRGVPIWFLRFSTSLKKGNNIWQGQLRLSYGPLLPLCCRFYETNHIKFYPYEKYIAVPLATP